MRLPPIGTVVIAKVLDHRSNRTTTIELRRVDESDCDWRTTDDDSELCYDVSVKSWRTKGGRH